MDLHWAVTFCASLKTCAEWALQGWRLNIRQQLQKKVKLYFSFPKAMLKGPPALFWVTGFVLLHLRTWQSHSTEVFATLWGGKGLFFFVCLLRGFGAGLGLGWVFFFLSVVFVFIKIPTDQSTEREESSNKSGRHKSVTGFLVFSFLPSPSASFVLCI